jgi:glutamate decarboxylase
MLGLFTNGGTMANVSAMWVARNHCLGPQEDETGKRIFQGVERTGLPKALKYNGYDDAIIIGSALMHYSMNKAADVLGMGLEALVKIPCDTNYRVNMEQMEERILEARANKECIVAIIGICGTTETGAIDPLEDMAALAAKYDIHFHVDAAWGGPCIFSNTHRYKCRGIELADSVTLDGHKQLWLPMGAGMVFFKDPYRCLCVRKTANYIIRKESYDLGKFTIDGSRGGNALFLHANLQLLGLRGYEVLIDRTVRVAQYMARRVLRSRNYELVVKPMMNILLYRWIPASMRDKVWACELTKEDQKYIDDCNIRLQNRQKGEGRTFVSRTTINAPQYDQLPIVALRVVIGNPLTTERNIDAVLDDQANILDQGEVTKDFCNEHLFHTDHCAHEPPKMAGVLRQTSTSPPSPNPSDEESENSFKTYWERVWDEMPRKNRFLFGEDIEAFFDALSTPDCFLKDSSTSSLVRKESHSQLNM